MAETRNCPKCDTMMDYRLGEYECPSCGHREGSMPAQAGGGQRTTSGPGFQAPPPPSRGMPGPGMPGSTFGGYHGSPHDPASRGAAANGLSQEKWYLIGFYIAQYVIMGAMAAGSPNVAQYGGPVIIFIVMLVFAFIGAGILYFVLHTDQSWIKYCCMGCVGLGFISQIGQLLAPTALNNAGILSPAAQVISTLLGLIYAVWLISILYRDTQQQY